MWAVGSFSLNCRWCTSSRCWLLPLLLCVWLGVRLLRMGGGFEPPHRWVGWPFARHTLQSGHWYHTWSMFCLLLGIVSMGEDPICLPTSGLCPALFVVSFLCVLPSVLVLWWLILRSLLSTCLRCRQTLRPWLRSPHEPCS